MTLFGLQRSADDTHHSAPLPIPIHNHHYHLLGPSKFQFKHDDNVYTCNSSFKICKVDYADGGYMDKIANNIHELEQFIRRLGCIKAFF